MRVRVAIGAVTAIATAAYAELVLDIRTPRSGLAAGGALAAVISFPTGEPDPPKKLAGMYGLFVVRSDGTQSVFPFSMVPGNAGSSAYRPPLAQLRDRFGSSFPASPDAADDPAVKSNSCSASPPAELGLGWLTEYIQVKAQASCVVHQNGGRPGAMLISVTLADADPWARPFARRICRPLAAAALEALGSADAVSYAACVLVDRPGRLRPGDAQDTFQSVVYEVRDHKLARMD